MPSGHLVYVNIVQRRQLGLMGKVWADFEGQTFCNGGRAVGMAVFD